MLDKGEVESVVLKSDTLTVTLKHGTGMAAQTKTVTLMEDLSELTKRLEKAGVKSFDKEQPNIAGELIYSLLSILIPVVLMVALFSFMFRRMNKGGGMMGGVGKSKAKAYVQKETGVTFRDVAGQDEARMRPRNLSRRWWISFTIRGNIRLLVPSCPKVPCW